MAKFRISLVDLHAQYLTIQPEIDAAIARVISKSAFILGEEVEAFEKEFAEYCGVKYCIGCGNGTDAISMALQAVGVKSGDEVITVANTFIATTESISSVGAKPVLVDVRDDTLLMDVSKVEAAVTKRTRAIIPVHLYGQMVDMDPLMDIARRHHLAVVEDCAQAHGASYKGRRAGSIGSVATFSFFPAKNLGAYGDAGAVVTNDPTAAAWLAKVRNHGRAKKYEHDFEGRNSRMDGLQGAILRAKLKHLPIWTQRRRELAALYRAQLGTGMRTVIEAPYGEAVYYMFVVRHPRREELLARLNRSGIEGGIHYPLPLHRQPAYKHLGYRADAFPVTNAAAGEILSLPLYPEMTGEILEQVVDALREY